ncbi:nanos homolog 3-like [Physella acuta]|uniref:nanos homolog 3-like n=1 Tax=Physella acuta TaxID=109671 RepID=UPI0027DC0B47|nr:nanos homolog 3-like [Physella acuta]
MFSYADLADTIEDIRHEFETNGISQEMDALDWIKYNSKRKKLLKNLYVDDVDDDTAVLLEEIDKERQSLMRKRPLANKMHCVFCKNNKEQDKVYNTHLVKNSKGDTTCPILAKYSCPKCYATGTKAHTIKYCPYNDHGLGVMDCLLKTPRNGAGRKRGSSTGST